MDITNKPGFLRKYKIQPGTNEPVETKRLMNVINLFFFFCNSDFISYLQLLIDLNLITFQVILVVIINQLAVGIPMAILAYRLMMYRGFAPLRELPTFHWVLFELAVLILLEEIGFYYSHR